MDNVNQSNLGHFWFLYSKSKPHYLNFVFLYLSLKQKEQAQNIFPEIYSIHYHDILLGHIFVQYKSKHFGSLC